MVKARKGSGFSVAWGIVFILMRQPLLPRFRMCSEPVGGGLAPRRPWLVDDLQGTLSHILHPCQVGAGGREAGSTQSSLSGNREQHCWCPGRREKNQEGTRPPHPSRSKSGGSVGGSAGPGPWHAACEGPRVRPLCDRVPFLRARSRVQRRGSSALRSLSVGCEPQTEQRGRRRKRTKGEPGVVRTA